MDCDPLYISSGEEESSQLFITQNSFREPDTQDLDEAVDFFDGFEGFDFGSGNANISEPNYVEQRDMSNITSGDHSQFTEDEMCSMIFNFTKPKPSNSWTILNNGEPWIVRRHSDGKIFVCKDEGMVEYVPPSVPDDVQKDLDRFSTVVSDEELNAMKNKW